MKRTKILFWIVTSIFSAFMIFTAIPDLLVKPEAVSFMTDQLGYPKYIIPFIGACKILGVIAILIPGFPRIKEWAYAGLFFDLAGAVYSNVSVWGFMWPMLTMIPVFGFLFWSYFLYHKLRKGQTV